MSKAATEGAELGELRAWMRIVEFVPDQSVKAPWLVRKALRAYDPRVHLSAGGITKAQLGAVQDDWLATSFRSS